MNIIDPAVLACDTLKTEPYYWGIQKDLIKKNMQRLLINEFPSESFVAAERLEGNGKHYRFEVLNIIENDKITSAYPKLSSVWKQFIDDLRSDTYIKLLGNYIKTEIKDFALDIGLFRFKQNNWVEVHTDRQDKILTQLFYFNENWNNLWGGELYVLAEPDLSSVLSKVKPAVDHSAVIVRADNAWHYVSPVENAAKSPRLSLQVEIIKKK